MMTLFICILAFALLVFMVFAIDHIGRNDGDMRTETKEEPSSFDGYCKKLADFGKELNELKSVGTYSQDILDRELVFSKTPKPADRRVCVDSMVDLDDIENPYDGMMAFYVNTKKLYIRSAGQWQEVGRYE